MDAQKIRNTAAGFIGGRKIAEKATDEEVILLAKMKSECAKHYNRHIEIEKNIKRIQKQIKKR